MARTRQRKRLMSEINVVPYIDVMLVLLIIFMITAPLVTQGVKVKLPQVASEVVPPTDKEPVIVTVDAQGDYYVNYGEAQDRPISGQQLAARVNSVLRNQPDVPVLVEGDHGVAYGKVVELMALLQGVGVPSVGLITEPPANATPSK